MAEYEDMMAQMIRDQQKKLRGVQRPAPTVVPDVGPMKAAAQKRAMDALPEMTVPYVSPKEPESQKEMIGLLNEYQEPFKFEKKTSSAPYDLSAVKRRMNRERPSYNISADNGGQQQSNEPAYIKSAPKMLPAKVAPKTLPAKVAYPKTQSVMGATVPVPVLKPNWTIF